MIPVLAVAAKNSNIVTEDHNQLHLSNRSYAKKTELKF